MPELGSPQLTTKELTMIVDQLANEQLAIAKFQSYAAQATDSEVQRLCEASARKHLEHYDTLLKHLRAKEIGKEGV